MPVIRVVAARDRPPHTTHSALDADQGVALLRQCLDLPVPSPKQHQFGKPLDAFHGSNSYFCRAKGQTPAQVGGGSGRCQGEGDAGDQQEQEGGSGDPDIENSQKQHHGDCGQYTGGAGGKHTDIEVVQGFNVGHDTVQDVHAVVWHQSGRRQWLNLAVKPEPEGGQHPKGGIVDHNTFGIPGQGAGEGKQPDTDAGIKEVEQIGRAQGQPGQGGGSDEPA